MSTIWTDETGVMLCMLGNVKVLTRKEDPQDYRGAGIKRTNGYRHRMHQCRWSGFVTNDYLASLYSSKQLDHIPCSWMVTSLPLRYATRLITEVDYSSASQQPFVYLFVYVQSARTHMQ
ncbi:hypothetical protein B0T17DRAFT_409734 [Bombardia bombarda]|uniref:Uncharacterized protein n=1 Tax=Bombardia bombarda TaxID=252184 RepID=A0AA39TPP3_9PEZI|nr:hypothetical protein B0T17DRAFT_409734 [Bombardia bombarda]